MHDYLHIVLKTMDHTKCLCAGHLCFILGQSVQLPQYVLDLRLAITKKLLGEFL